MTPYRFTRIIGFLALAIGLIILLRDAVQVHSLPYAIAGVGLLAFGAWRLQAAARLRP
ncbi:MAG TPA: hypothetical protein VIT43_09925 [Candidatus Dormibacteraeota bacterium]